MELVKRVTGHKTTAIVLEHYFRPDRKTFTDAFAKALPEVLTGKSSAEHSLDGVEAIDTMTRLLKKMKQGDATSDDRMLFQQLAAKVA